MVVIIKFSFHSNDTIPSFQTNIYMHWQAVVFIERLRGSICKSGLLDLAWKIDFTHFLCVARYSCFYTKTTIHSGLLNFSCFKGFSVTRENARDDRRYNNPSTKQAPQLHYYTLFSRHFIFAIFAIFRKSRKFNLMSRKFACAKIKWPYIY